MPRGAKRKPDPPPKICERCGELFYWERKGKRVPATFAKRKICTNCVGGSKDPEVRARKFKPNTCTVCGGQYYYDPARWRSLESFRKTKTCGKACRYKKSSTSYQNRYDAPGPFNCAECKTEVHFDRLKDQCFVTFRKRKYCSIACRSVAYRRRYQQARLANFVEPECLACGRKFGLNEGLKRTVAEQRKYCSRECYVSTIRRTSEDFKALAGRIHGGIYDYGHTVYNCEGKPVRIDCNLHGPFYRHIRNHLIGYGCPKCKRGPMVINASQLKEIDHLLEPFSEFAKTFAVPAQ